MIIYFNLYLTILNHNIYIIYKYSKFFILIFQQYEFNIFFIILRWNDTENTQQTP